MYSDGSGHSPEWNWGSFWKGLGFVAAGIGAIVAGALVIASGVALLPMLIVAGVTIGAGVLTTVNGVAELISAGTGYNFVRDGIFQGNSSAYNWYSGITSGIATVGSIICGGWLRYNKPRIQAYNNVQNYGYTKTISDSNHMSRLYANSVLTQKEVIKYGAMTKDSFGYVFSTMGSVNGKEKLWRLGVSIAEELVWHWGHGF